MTRKLQCQDFLAAEGFNLTRQRSFSRNGFTLVEVLITVAILGTMTLLVAQTTQQAIKSKIKLQSKIDDISKIRDALYLMERDINLAFHYIDIDQEIKKLLKRKNQQSAQGKFPLIDPATGLPKQSSGQIPEQPEFPEQPPEAPPIDPTTHFIGSAESLYFPTMNNTQMVKNLHQADFTTVGYSLKDCKNIGDKPIKGKCLWRLFSPHVGPDPTKGGDEVVLLEQVTEFKLRYIGKGKEDWVNDWVSNERGDGATKNHFPEAVEISLTVEKEEKGKIKKYSMQIVAPIHFSNNPAIQGSQNGSVQTPQ